MVLCWWLVAGGEGCIPSTLHTNTRPPTPRTRPPHLSLTHTLIRPRAPPSEESRLSNVAPGLIQGGGSPRAPSPGENRGFAQRCDPLHSGGLLGAGARPCPPPRSSSQSSPQKAPQGSTEPPYGDTRPGQQQCEPPTDQRPRAVAEEERKHAARGAGARPLAALPSPAVDPASSRHPEPRGPQRTAPGPHGSLQRAKSLPPVHTERVHRGAGGAPRPGPSPNPTGHLLWEPLG